jgi:hypothetical protein
LVGGVIGVVPLVPLVVGGTTGAVVVGRGVVVGSGSSVSSGAAVVVAVVLVGVEEVLVGVEVVAGVEVEEVVGSSPPGILISTPYCLQRATAPLVAAKSIVRKLFNFYLEKNGNLPAVSSALHLPWTQVTAVLTNSSFLQAQPMSMPQPVLERPPAKQESAQSGKPSS